MTHSPSRQMMAAGNLFVDSFRYGLGLLSRNQWGIAHRRWLLDSGRYIRTSERRWKVIGEDGPELVKIRPGGSHS